MTICPAASTPCTWKTDFAMSRPIVATVCISSSSESWEPQRAPHLDGTLVPVEEPSTASHADSCTAAQAAVPARLDLGPLRHGKPWYRAVATFFGSESELSNQFHFRSNKAFAISSILGWR